MRKLLSLFKGLCSVGALVILYCCVTEIVAGGKNILPWALAALFSAGVSVVFWVLAVVYDKVENMEDTLGIYVDKGYESDGIEQKECPVCHRDIDMDYAVCPYCENRNFSEGENPFGEKFENRGASPVFNTENDDYNGTDYSGEPPLSAWGDDNAPHENDGEGAI